MHVQDMTGTEGAHLMQRHRFSQDHMCSKLGLYTVNLAGKTQHTRSFMYGV